jgi:cytochrome b involved in lipid metabolism
MKTKYFITLSLLSFVLILSGCGTKGAQAPVINQTPEAAVSNNPALSLEEVSKHASANDCWMMIDGQFYDLSSYIQSAKHPGGEKIVNGCGKDASAMFAEIKKHDSRAREELANHLIVR